MYDMYCDFDLKKHKETYTNYLEVIIDEDGKVEYAIPSHQEKLIHMVCDKLDIDRQELMDMCPPEYYFDFMKWLNMQVHAVAVWCDGVMFDTINKKQINVLKQMKLFGVYRGVIPRICK